MTGSWQVALNQPAWIDCIDDTALGALDEPPFFALLSGPRAGKVWRTSLTTGFFRLGIGPKELRL